MTTKLIISIISFIVLCGWTIQQKSDIKRAEWLIGTWENKTSKGSIYESWNKKSDMEYSGKSYIVKDNDTIVFETIRLVQEENGLFYIPVVNRQNSGLPVRFALKAISDTTLVFENLQHDYPQTISYRKTGKDSLVAEISGNKNGQYRRQSFPMRRME